MKFLSDLTAQELNQKRILMRCDLNVPMKNGVISDDTRIKHILPTLNFLLKFNCQIHLISHFGRPKGRTVPELSLKFLAPILTDYLSEAVDFESGDAKIILHENLRFAPGEENNDTDFAQNLSNGFDLYINDAFSACHRAHASVSRITEFLPSYAGLGLEAEIKALEAIFKTPKPPVLAIVGGAKVSTKITVLENIIPKIDHLILGGAMANTFLKATDVEIGKSLVELDHLTTARNVIKLAKQHDCTLHLPLDAVCNTSFDSRDTPQTFATQDVPKDMMIFDIGPTTIAAYKTLITTCKTVLWNGPLGVFEKPPYDTGTNSIAQYVSAQDITSVAGGGDTYAALNHANAASDFTYVSCAGGAFLEWLEGKTLSGIASLN